MDTTMKKLPPKPVDTKKKIQHWTIAIVTVVLIIWSFVVSIISSTPPEI